MPVLHQSVADEAKLGLYPRALAIEHGIRIAGGGVCLIAPLFAVEVDLLIASAARGWLAAAILVPGPQALHAGPGFNEGSIDREVIRREKLLDPGLRQDGRHEL